MSRPHFFLLPCLALFVLLAACSSPPPATEKESKPAAAAEPPKKEEPAGTPEAAKADPNIYRVRFDTSKGPLVLEVHRDWAPLGAERFRQLVEDKFFDQARFFRYVPNFVIQFGLAASPAKTKKWDKPIKDDPVARTNGVGTLAFATAGPNTRTSQIFINLRSNQTLDDQGFAPFARIVEGIDVIGKIYAEYGEEPDQERITNQGNAYLNAKFPKLDYIIKATII
jgi:cyclophilin family peptidyl-prolyl cis-trans isomerase